MYNSCDLKTVPDPFPIPPPHSPAACRESSPRSSGHSGPNRPFRLTQFRRISQLFGHAGPFVGFEKPLKPAFDSIVIPKLALPNSYHSPAVRAEFPGVSSITLFVEGELLFPELLIRGWHGRPLAVVVAMPEASMHEQNHIPISDNKIGTAWQ